MSENKPPPMPLHVSRKLISEYGNYGDIVTVGSKEHPELDIHGRPIPYDQEFVLVEYDD